MNRILFYPLISHALTSQRSDTRPTLSKSLFGLRTLLFLLICLLPGLLFAQKTTYRQPAYINNAYFSDKISQKGDNVQPLSVVKAFQTRSTGILGYFILDLVLTANGTHHFKVKILDQNGAQTTELVYPSVKVTPKDQLPMYTAAGTISGDLEPGLWFFKVYDQVNKKQTTLLGTFSIIIMNAKKN